jgi:disulfide bond formation protein DsbB
MSFRLAAGIAAAVCAGLFGFGLYLQYGQGLEPCPLCLVQRAFFILAMASFLAGAMHGRHPRLYGIPAALFALGGAATATRQVWLQHLPKDQLPACGPDLAFMLENFPLGRMLRELFRGSGQCAEVDWTFLGLSIAEWSLAWFVALAAWGLWLALRAPRDAAR